MRKINEIKEEIIERYNISWDGMKDEMGLIEEAKQNFRNSVEDLIKEVKQYYKSDQIKY